MSRIKVLNVAEKPSVAREVSTCLSGNTARRVAGGCGLSECFSWPCNTTLTAHSLCCCRARVWNHLFDYNLNGQQCEMVFAAVAGHLQSLDFTSQHKNWTSCSPIDLYTAPVVKYVPEVCEPQESWRVARRQSVCIEKSYSAATLLAMLVCRANRTCCATWNNRLAIVNGLYFGSTVTGREKTLPLRYTNVLPACLPAACLPACLLARSLARLLAKVESDVLFYVKCIL